MVDERTFVYLHHKHTYANTYSTYNITMVVLCVCSDIEPQTGLTPYLASKKLEYKSEDCDHDKCIGDDVIGGDVDNGDYGTGGAMMITGWY
jgi:hypothetical protein